MSTQPRRRVFPPPRWRPLYCTKMQGYRDWNLHIWLVRSLLRAPKFISADLRRESQAKAGRSTSTAAERRLVGASGILPCGHTQRLCRPRSEQARKMGRRKIDIVRIENERHRQVTYTKRKTGLLKKATELAILCDAQVAVMIFSQNQKLCVYSSAPMEQLMKQYKDYSEAPEVCAAAASGRHCQAAHRGGFFKLHREPARRAAHRRCVRRICPPHLLLWP
jgi:hypothetical protein